MTEDEKACRDRHPAGKGRSPDSGIAIVRLASGKPLPTNYRSLSKRDFERSFNFNREGL